MYEVVILWAQICDLLHDKLDLPGVQPPLVPLQQQQAVQNRQGLDVLAFPVGIAIGSGLAALFPGIRTAIVV